MRFCPECGKELLEDAIYCSACGARLFISSSAGTGRPGTITAASILCGVLGGFEALGALILLAYFPFLTEILREIPYFGIVSARFLIGIGIITLILGILYIVACNLLWKSRKSGGIIGVMLGALGILSSFAPSIGGLSLLSMIPNITIIALIALGWNSLK